MAHTTTNHLNQWQTTPSMIQSIIFGGLRHCIPMDMRLKYQGTILKCEGDKQSQRSGEVRMAHTTTNHSSQWQTAPSAIQSVIFGGF